MSDLEASVAVPSASLIGFKRVHLEAGQTRLVKFILPPRHLELFDDNGERVLEPGTFVVTVGGASPGDRSRALGAPQPVRKELIVGPQDDGSASR